MKTCEHMIISILYIPPPRPPPIRDSKAIELIDEKSNISKLSQFLLPFENCSAYHTIWWLHVTAQARCTKDLRVLYTVKY